MIYACDHEVLLNENDHLREHSKSYRKVEEPVTASTIPSSATVACTTGKSMIYLSIRSMVWLCAVDQEEYGRSRGIRVNVAYV